MLEPKRLMDWKGLKVVSDNPIQNGLATLPAGTEWIVTSVSIGMTLQSLPCEKCGIEMSVSKVKPINVRPVQADLNYEILLYNEKCFYTINDPTYLGRRLITPHNEEKPKWQI